MDEGPSRKSPQELGREERLAAKLRENLRRRKAQARQMSDSSKGEWPEIPEKPCQN